MKNIIALSDGTGNGAAKRHQTNVWRLYRALDIHRPDQVAFYDDGVGSQEFLLLKLLGGILGWGLKRNVIELYKFLCRTYQPGIGGNQGDRIFLFGFSRGAFTVRLLAGMIDYCGLYTGYTSEKDLHRTARNSYSAFRSKFNHGYLIRAIRFSAGIRATPPDNVKPRIEFIGVWDTVDAYGLPIDELAILWDRLIFSIRFPDRQLSPIVNRACHALSIDDERLTFHPVLWDESQETTNRIEQVWFSGVHSDVGGGYPRNALSLVTLDWMMSKVEAATPTGPGLHFIQQTRTEYLNTSDWHGLQHDSRSGFAAYYRYKPREIGRICNDQDNGVFVSCPRIHRGVFERIRDDIVPYAPAGLPAAYQVVTTRGKAPVYEPPPQDATRALAANRALDVVYWRKQLYWAFMVPTLLFVASPIFFGSDPEETCVGTACVLEPPLKLVMGVLPDFTAVWFETLLQNPCLLWGVVGAFLVFTVLKVAARKSTEAKATAAWSTLRGRVAPPPWTPTLTSRLRGATGSKLRTFITWAPLLLLFFFILYLCVVVASRTGFHIQSTLGLLCKGSETTRALTGFEERKFDIGNACYATALLLEKGSTYRFTVKHAAWKDGKIDGGPDGVESPTAFMRASVPLRRMIAEPYLKFLGRIDRAGNDNFVIGSGPTEYTAKSDGELFLYVNDVVFGLFPGEAWSWPYRWQIGKNVGTAEVSVEVIPVSRTGERHK